ncbi:lipid IV(A) 3-deoxy-D-manno-octulosonic acid transferase [Neisseriaceae bacterium TC5R-5]|nr:lipid IV(A) 3-deoxy-D-manno-octulosonic acid transferase [Neisseriaceae bacterium TC5R-5]
MSWQRRLYGVLWLLLTPLIRFYLRKRARKSPAYLQYWDERFGKHFAPRVQNAIWIHAVSVGETQAALPLIQALRQHWPDAPLLLTQMTPTGRATAERLYPDAEVRYLPYDYPQAARAFLQAYQPRFGVLMETELWPNLIYSAAEQQIPLFLVNARLSEKSSRSYRRIQGLIKPALARLTAIAAQTPADAQRLQALGAVRLYVCGNTKYDIAPPAQQLVLAQQFKQAIGPRKVLVCVSTREGEEALILDAWQAANRPADNLLVLVPRHPERFAKVIVLAEQRGISWQRRSDNQPVNSAAQLWLGDSMGEVFAYLGCADVAFVGGSLLPFGCHNLIEPASVGVPVLFGPSTFNFTQAALAALAAGAAIQVQDASQLITEVSALFADDQRRLAMQDAALSFSVVHRGASERIVHVLQQFI